MIGRPVRVLLGALVAAATLLALSLAVGEPLEPFSSDDPGSESVRARSLISDASGVDPYFGVVVLVETPAGTEASASRARVERVGRALRAEDTVAAVRDFYDSGDPTLVANDGRSTYVVGGLAPVAVERQLDAARRLRDRLGGVPGVTVGGRALFYAQGNDTAKEDLLRAELIVFPLLLLVTLWVFRGLVAALLPLAVGGLTVAAAVAALRLASELTSISIYALNIVTALGLGLAVDYSLLLLSRYREEGAARGFGPATLRAALASAGRTVLFSSLTVAGAGTALLVFPQPFLRSIGLGTILVALLAGSVSLVVLPALLGLLGARVNSLSPAAWRRAAEKAARPATAGGWYRLSRVVMRHPGWIAAGAAALLLGLGAPALDMRLTQVGPEVVPEGSSDRLVSEAIERDFPPGGTAPVYLAFEVPPVEQTAAEARLEAFGERAGRLPGVAAATPPRAASRRVWTLEVLPSEPPLSRTSEALVRRLRALPSPYPVAVGGETASLVDLRAGLRDYLPLALAILLLVTVIPLIRVTGSLVLPVKAIAMNALTLFATFGVMVLVFQRGAFEGLLGYTSVGALEASVVVLIFAVAFGLATDYGVFLLARIRETRERGADDREAVALGLERTGRVVTAAALLLCVALASLMSARHGLVKQVGAGTALAVAIDATIVRALLVPSLMQLLGRRNWWAPRFLRGLAPSPGRPAAAAPEFLGTTRYCDIEHPAVRAAAERIAAGSHSQREAAVRLFEFVRDEIPYAFGPWGVSASETLATRGGTCTNKSNLLVALLRASGIPAGYAVLSVNAQRYFGVIGPSYLTRFASSRSIHVQAAALIDGRWVRCDPSTDRPLSELTAHFCAQTRLVVWDGTRDAVDILDPNHIYEDRGVFHDIDELLDKPARSASPEVLALANSYLRFIRTHPPFESPEELIEAFRSELERSGGQAPHAVVPVREGGM